MVLNTLEKITKKVLNKHQNVYPKLCTPAKIEYIIALIGLVSLSISCLTETSGSTFNDVCAELLPYILTATTYIYILNALCKGGASIFSWIIVLSPILVIISNIMTKTCLLKPELFEEYDEEEYNEDPDEDEDFKKICDGTK
jgi:hypothetical protein